jgi:solute carrier family 35 (UDP-sugar transporter), member A1/2/3
MAFAMTTFRNISKTDYLKYVSLLTLIFQNAALILWMRYVRTTPGDMFISTTAVVCAEAFKCMASLFIILIEVKGIRQWLHHLRENIFSDPWDNIKISVPSLVYTLQNNLQFLAISNLDAATYQVCYQLKILTTALLSALMLNKKLSRVQWLSLVILFAGVACVQFQPSEATTDAADGEAPKHNWFIGMTAVAVSCLMSGFAGVYFEKILKGTKQSVWVRNVQLGFIGVLIGLVTMWINDGAQVREKGFFFGYTWAVWLAVALQSFGGLLVAVVVKYADNILKGFATSAAIVLSCVASMAFLDFQLSAMFTIGASLVIVAVYLYSRGEISRARNPDNNPDRLLPLHRTTAAHQPGNHPADIFPAVVRSNIPNGVA